MIRFTDHERYSIYVDPSKVAVVRRNAMGNTILVGNDGNCLAVIQEEPQDAADRLREANKHQAAAEFVDELVERLNLPQLKDIIK
jgi:hypothetical protein